MDRNIFKGKSGERAGKSYNGREELYEAGVKMQNDDLVYKAREVAVGETQWINCAKLTKDGAQNIQNIKMSYRD